MRIAILSDVHANLEALSAVLEHARRQRAERFVCLGDVVGYGADPVACLELVLETCSVTVAGNHDLAAAGQLSVRRFQSLARTSVEFTRHQLSRVQRRRLGRLPPEAEIEGLLLVHASPV